MGIQMYEARATKWAVLFTLRTSSSAQAHREGGGVTGASAPGPGGPKGARRAPSKKI